MSPQQPCNAVSLVSRQFFYFPLPSGQYIQTIWPSKMYCFFLSSQLIQTQIMQCLICTEDLEVKNFKSRQITSYMYILTLKFGYHLPLDSEAFHHLNKLKFPSYKASLCQVYTDLMALRFCRINLTSRQNIFTISLLHPLLRKRIRAT